MTTFNLQVSKMSTLIKCGGCLKPIEGKQYLRCNLCALNYDLSCANVSEQRYLNTMTRDHKKNWKCMLCISKQPKGDNSNTPIRAANDDGVTTKRGASKESPPERVESLPINNALNTLLNDDIKVLISEVRQFKEEMRATRKQMEELSQTMSRLNDRVDACDVRIDALCDRVSSLENRVMDGAGVEPIDGTLRHTIHQLKTELNERDQELLLNDIEISCVPEQKGTGLTHVVLTLANKLGVPLMEQDIVSAVRVGRPPGPEELASSGATSTRPRPIVVRLTRRALRDQLLQAARTRRGATTEGTGLSDAPRRFYINERLTRTNRQLFRKARDCGRRLNWRFVWTKDGRAYARQHAGKDAPRHRLQSEEDLIRVFGKDVVSSLEV